MLDLDRVYVKILKNETDTITRNEMSSVNYLYKEMYNNTLLNPIHKYSLGAYVPSHHSGHLACLCYSTKYRWVETKDIAGEGE